MEVDGKFKTRAHNKNMTKELRLKIWMDMNKDPEDKSQWTYEQLEKAIKYHAFEPVNPATLVKNILELTRGENIDETNNRVEEWIDSLGQSTDARGPTTTALTEEQKKKEINRFKTDDMKYGLKWLLLRAHLTTDIAQQVRTLEITTNEGLGLDNGKLIDYVRQLEKNKKEKERVEWTNTRDNNKYKPYSQDKKRSYEANKKPSPSKKFHTLQKKLLNGCCPKCGEKFMTPTHCER